MGGFIAIRIVVTFLFLLVSPLASAGLEFLDSKKGISHSPKEHTSLELIETGTNFLLQSLIKILAKSNS